MLNILKTLENDLPAIVPLQRSNFTHQTSKAMKTAIFLLTLLCTLLTTTPQLHAQVDEHLSNETVIEPSDSLIIQQYRQVKPYFQEAYRLYPSLPRGILEAVSFTYSRFHHLRPDAFPHEKGQIPATYGMMGLTLDGEGFFQNNLVKVSLLSGVPVNKIIQSPRDNILAYAAAYHKLMQQYGITTSDLASHFPILDSLSELPEPTTAGLKWALTNQHYAYALFINHPLYRKICQIEMPKVDILLVFSIDATLLQSNSNIINCNQQFDKENITDKNTQNSKFIETDNVDYLGAIWCPAGTCNYSSRNGHEISAITIHYTQGTYAGSIAWFQNCTYNGVGARASAHYVLRSIDGQVTQMVREADKAWHVGNCNPYTVGIEHEAYGDIASYFTTAMYESSAQLTRNICDRHGISPLRMFYRDTLDDGTVLNSGLHSLGGETSCIRIKGHQHFPDQSHTDPGPYWDWNRYYKLVNFDTPVTQYHTATGTLYDSGGPDGNYENDERQIVTIQVNDAEAIELLFTQFELETNYDFLWIYDGPSVFSPLIVRSNTISPGTVRSSGNAITLEFRSDCATTASGWMATWNAILPATQDNPPTTTILHNEEDWVTSNFYVDFEDQDDHGVAYRFYQVMGYDGTAWRAQTNRGFACDNFDDFNTALWTAGSGSWNVSNHQLIQTSMASSQITTPLHQELSNAHLYDVYAAVSNCQPNGNVEIIFNADRPNVTTSGTAYSVVIFPRQHEVKIRRWVNGDIVTVDSVQGIYTTEGNNYFYRILYDRALGKIALFRGSTLLLQWQDPVPLAIPGQFVQFRTKGLYASFDNWRVYRSRTNHVQVLVGSEANNDLPWQANNSQPMARIKSVVMDDALHFSPLAQKELLVDYTRPTMNGTLNDGDQRDVDVVNTNIVSANWHSTSDPHSGIEGYEYAVFSSHTASRTPLLIGFTTGTHFSEQMRMRQQENYYIQVRALNGAGKYSLPLRSDGFTYQPYNETNRMTPRQKATPAISIAPNPCTEGFTIAITPSFLSELSEEFTGNEITMRIYDIYGREILKKKLLNTTERIDTKEWASGLYILQLWHNGEMITAEKILKE